MASLGVTVAADIIAGGGVIVVSSMVVLLFKRLPKELTQLSRDWFGQPARPGFPEIPGVPKRLQTVETTLGELHAYVIKIDHEMHPNSGSSIKDSVDRTDQAVTELREDVKSLHELIANQGAEK